MCIMSKGFPTSWCTSSNVPVPCCPCQLSDEPPPLEDSTNDTVTVSGEVEFPVDHLTHLDEQLGRPKWVVPVRPDDDLERLLRASIKLCKQGVCIYCMFIVCVCVLAESRWIHTCSHVSLRLPCTNITLHVLHVHVDM